MSAPAIEAQAALATGVAQELPNQPIHDGLPGSLGITLASGVPHDAHTRIEDVLNHVSGAWRVVSTDPRYERTTSPHGPNDNLFERLRSTWAEQRQRWAERQLGNLMLRPAQPPQHHLYHLPLSRMSK